MGVIFDLDNTLIDTSCTLELRSQRRWDEVYGMIPNLLPYEGINELLGKLNKNNIPICIVTSSPKSFCKSIIKQFRWENMRTVCYGDTRHHKPHPQPILKGVRLIGEEPQKVIAVGDRPKDIIAAKDAGTISIATLWGGSDKDEFMETEPDFVFNTVSELDVFLSELFNIKSV